MARDGVAVDARLAGVVARFVAGERLNVSAECSALGVTRQTFYKYVRRFRAEGVEGFFPRSRRPAHCPSMLAAGVEDAIVLARKRLDDAGLDIGATSIRWWLVDHPQDWDSGAAAVPSRATINRALDRRGLLVKHPQRRPRRTHRRFARPARNDLWQMDGFELRLSDGSKAVVIELIDDHTRLSLACQAAVTENGADAWAAFTAASSRYGLPRQLLTDNGTAFNGRRRGWTTDLDAAVGALGVDAISSSIGHPQTCGKIERAHSTLRRWLRRHPAGSLGELGDQLEHYRDIYNNRRHQALHGLTPAQAWALAPASGPYGSPLAAPLNVSTVPVSSSGCLRIDRADIGVGRRHKHKSATVFRSGDDIAIFITGRLIRDLTLDRTRRYQPLA